MDDIWEEDNETSLESMRSREWVKLRMQHSATGYREGISEGKESSLQEGFNKGFGTGSKRGITIGKLLGLISALDMFFQNHSDEASTLKSAFVSQVSTLNDELNVLSQQRNQHLQKMMVDIQDQDETPFNTQIINSISTFCSKMEEQQTQSTNENTTIVEQIILQLRTLLETATKEDV